METVLKTREFNYGVELLRIVSMLMVIILHILGQGGVLESCPVSPGMASGDYMLLCGELLCIDFWICND